MNCVLAALLLAQTAGAAPGPMDAFEANRATIHARIHYTYTAGSTNSSVIDRDTIWTEGLPFREDPDRTVIGLWETDGRVQHYVYGSPDEVIRRKTPLAKAGRFLPYTEPRELLYDGEVEALHVATLWNPISVFIGREPSSFGLAHGPFLWLGTHGPPVKFKAYPGPPRRTHAAVGGHATEVEVYVLTVENGPEKGHWVRREIFYDPSIGYLPRAVRSISFDPASGAASVKQVYLIAAKHISSGAFVPVERFEAYYPIPSFQAKYPDYREGMKLAPKPGDVAVGHFKADKVEDFKGVPKLDHLDKVKEIAGPGGVLVRLSPVPATLSIDEIRARLGRKLTNPSPPPKAAMPHPDRSEMRMLVDEPGGVGWAAAALIAAMSVLGTGLALWGFRRRIAALFAVAVAVCFASGCGHPAHPMIKLTAAFRPSSIVYKPGFGRLSIPMVLKNEGNLAIGILRAHGGCSCREIDHRHLPATLEPGRSMTLGVTLHERKHLEPQNIMLTFEANHGSFVVPAMLTAVPSHHFNPDSHSNVALTENEAWSFEFTQRQIYDPKEGRQDTSLEVPQAFEAVLEKAESGKLSAIPPYEFVDKTYRVTLKDTAFGLQKAALTLRGTDGSLLVESPVVWQRFPFLAANPPTVRIATRPVRVFLRCPDDSIELSKVRSAPAGVKAVVSWPREVTVMLDVNAPGIIDGVVVVETTAAGHPPLKIPVLRYSPATDAHAQRADQGRRAEQGHS